MKIGYARVSTEDQNLHLQIDALKKADCEKIFQEKISSTRERPELDKMLSTLRQGDKVVIWKLDRLGRSVKNLIELADRFRSEGVDLVVLQDHIDTSTPSGHFFFTMMAAFAQFERETISERTKAGQAAARARGRAPGRPAGLSPKALNKAASARHLFEQGKSPREITDSLGISIATFYRYLKPIQ